MRIFFCFFFVLDRFYWRMNSYAERVLINHIIWPSILLEACISLYFRNNRRKALWVSLFACFYCVLLLHSNIDFSMNEKNSWNYDRFCLIKWLFSAAATLPFQLLLFTCALLFSINLKTWDISDALSENNRQTEFDCRKMAFR